MFSPRLLLPLERERVCLPAAEGVAFCLSAVTCLIAAYRDMIGATAAVLVIGTVVSGAENVHVFVGDVVPDDAVSGLFLSAEGITAGFLTAARVGAPYADVGTAAAISLMVGAGGDAAL